ncbi:MAG: Bcr/CflA family efflux MFS transporter [Betaproteobacteria bacterium]|nr:MAG: Bcr/CflA family efflux MFS transporter [Betaproteobacteria bacterium]
MTIVPSARRASGQILIVLLGLLSMLGPFSNDTVLPNFPHIESHFGIGDVRMQQTLTLYFAPFAVMMLLHGTLSDAFGRRRIIVLGMAAYSAAAFVCATAQSFETLLLGRFLQGLSAGAGIVVGRAIVRDLYAGDAAQRALALLMIIFGIAPGVAPIIGGWIGHLFGWRAVFTFLTLLSAALCLLAFVCLPETLPPSRRTALSFGSIAKGFVQALRSARFVLLVCAFGFNFAGFFIYIVSAPVFGYRILGIEQTEFVWIFGPAIAGMIVGSYVSGQIAGRVNASGTVFIGYAFMAAAALFNVGYHVGHPAALPVSVLPIFVYTLGLGISMPSITVLVLDMMPERRGLASSMIGFAQSGFSAVLAGAVSHQVYENALTLALCSLVMGLLGFACWLGFLARLALRLRRARA